MTRSPQSDAAANGPNANDELYLLACRLERDRDKAAEDATNYHARIGELEQERDEARADCERLNRLLRAETALGQGDIDHWAELQRERDEANTPDNRDGGKAMSDCHIPQIIELTDGIKCVSLEDYKKLERERERDEAQADCERLNQLLRHETTLGQGDIDHWAALEAERDEAIAARKASAADWLNQVEQANARVSRALQQVALAERDRDEAREDVRKLQDIKRKYEHEELVAAQEIDRLKQERDEAIGSLCSTDCPPDTGDDSLHNVRRLRAQIRELEHENARLREVLGKMIKLASTGDWDGEDPLIEAEHILSNKGVTQ